MTSPREPTFSKAQMKRLDSRLALPQPSRPALARHSAPGLSRLRQAQLSCPGISAEKLDEDCMPLAGAAGHYSSYDGTLMLRC